MEAQQSGAQCQVIQPLSRLCLVSIEGGVAAVWHLGMALSLSLLRQMFIINLSIPSC